MIDPKPQKRYRASLDEWAFFRSWFSTDPCWVCGGKWQELHHILARVHSGDDQVENLAPLCSACHRKVEARDPEARAALRGALMPTNLAYLQDKLGENTLGWLERNYSPSKEAA